MTHALAVVILVGGATVFAAEMEPSISQKQAISIAVAKWDARHLKSHETKATLFRGNDASVAPLGVRDADPKKVKEWKASLAGRLLWKVDVCPVREAPGGKKEIVYCAVSLIDAMSGQDVSFP